MTELNKDEISKAGWHNMYVAAAVRRAKRIWFSSKELIVKVKKYEVVVPYL